MAKAAAMKNAYSVMPAISDVPTFELPGSRDYAVPAPNSDEENGFLDSPSGSYAAKLRAFPGGTPDPMRLGSMPTRVYHPGPHDPPEEFWSPFEADKDRAENEQRLFQDGNGIEENKGSLPMQNRFAHNPREVPTDEPRPTMRLMPRTYFFTRDMWGGPMRNNGEHFSMADFRRDYPILGTQPVRSWRNTYRIQPVPFDGDMVDVPADPGMVIPDQVYESPVPAMAGNQWRLT